MAPENCVLFQDLHKVMRHHLIRRAYIKNVFSPISTIMAFQLIDPIKQPILGVIKQM